MHRASNTERVSMTLPWYSRAPLQRVSLYDILYCSTVTDGEHINYVFIKTKTPHISPLRASYGVSIMGFFLKKIDRDITAPHCIWEIDCYSRCYSYVGMVPIPPQQLNLADACLWEVSLLGVKSHERQYIGPREI